MINSDWGDTGAFNHSVQTTNPFYSSGTHVFYYHPTGL